MRAIYIDPRARSISEIDVAEESGDAKLAALQALVGGYIEAAYFDEAMLFVNEEGLFESGNPVFLFDGQPLAGPGVVCGALPGPNGETSPTTLSVGVVASRVTWTAATVR